MFLKANQTCPLKPERSFYSSVPKKEQLLHKNGNKPLKATKSSIQLKKAALNALFLRGKEQCIYENK